MSKRRILSIWFPCLGAERVMRTEALPGDQPLAIVAEERNLQAVVSVNGAAAQAGVHPGQPVRDAHAMCAGLLTRARNAPAEAQFLAALRRWAGKFSPWVADEPPDGLVIDLSGCAHLFGGEAALLEVIAGDCADLGLSVRTGIGDTLGAAWALARYAGRAVGATRSGDAVDQEARATRSRAGKRHWVRGGAAPQARAGGGTALRIAPPGQSHGALGPLPVAALRLDPATLDQLGRLGLRRVGDLLGQPRAGLARRFGKGLVLRLDQAMGSTPEPISPASDPHHFAVRLTLPDPIGLKEDLMAGIDRMLPRLCERLREKGCGLRCLRLEAHRTDQQAQMLTIGFARPGHDPARIRPLIDMKLDELDAGFGIDMLRLEAVQTETLQERNRVGHLGADRAVRDRLAAEGALEDLIGKLGARIGLEAITRRSPADSHLPEKTAQTLAAAWSGPAGNWQHPASPRPLILWPPEPVHIPAIPHLPARFRWRGRDRTLAQATGPERISPEWWLDDPDWRTGTRDYWTVLTDDGDRLWLYFGHGATKSPGWFCHGRFA